MKQWHDESNITSPALAFKADLKQAKEIQKQILFKITGMSLEEFRNKVPLCSYKNYEKKILHASQTGIAILPNDEIVAFEQTSGTNSPAKLIPITTNGLTAMRSAIDPWFDDILANNPTITDGSIFIAVSPATRSLSYTNSGHRIGLPDSAYFSKGLQDQLLDNLAVSADVSLITNVDQWLETLLKQLVNASDLSFISIWSPTYLLMLIKALDEKLSIIVPNIDPVRVEKAKQALECHNLSILWPELKLLSCWTDGQAARHVTKLKEYFPEVPIQGKGLLSTEAIVTIPLYGYTAPVLTPRTAFFEFIDESDEIYLCHELKQGRSYRLVITTHSGLLRYDLGDQVRVEGFIGTAPMLKFMGRTGLVVDLCGEKISEDFVLEALEPIKDTPAVLAPTPEDIPCYRLFLDEQIIYQRSADFLNNLPAVIDKNLCKNFQYAYARRINQMQRLEVWYVKDLDEKYTNFLSKQGALLSVLKLPILSKINNLEHVFDATRSFEESL